MSETHKVSVIPLRRQSASYEIRTENMLKLKQGESFESLTLKLKAKHPLSGFITGTVKTNDTIVDQGVSFTVGKVDSCNNLSEVKLLPQQPKLNSSKIPIVTVEEQKAKCVVCDKEPIVFALGCVVCGCTECKPKGEVIY